MTTTTTNRRARRSVKSLDQLGTVTLDAAGAAVQLASTAIEAAVNVAHAVEDSSAILANNTLRLRQESEAKLEAFEEDKEEHLAFLKEQAQYKRALKRAEQRKALQDDIAEAKEQGIEVDLTNVKADK